MLAFNVERCIADQVTGIVSKVAGLRSNGSEVSESETWYRSANIANTFAITCAVIEITAAAIGIRGAE